MQSSTDFHSGFSDETGRRGQLAAPVLRPVAGWDRYDSGNGERLVLRPQSFEQPQIDETDNISGLTASTAWVPHFNIVIDPRELDFYASYKRPHVRNRYGKDGPGNRLKA